MLIDQYLPHYHVRAQYQLEVNAPLARAYAAARNLDMRASPLVRWLYRLRGMPPQSLSLEGMLQWGFVMLAEQPPEEFVFGLIGRFWSHSPQVQPIEARAFAAFDQPGLAKAAGNMTFTPQRDGRLLLATETRVHCLDEASRRSFRRYWLLIGPFSGLIRREWLRLVKQRAEAPPTAHPSPEMRP